MNTQTLSYVEDTFLEESEKILLRENHYFPTQIFSVELSENVATTMNENLIAAIYEERTRDSKGIQKSNFRALGGWHSQNHLHKEESYQSLVKHINSCCRSIEEMNGYHQDYRLGISTMWSIINPPGSSNRAHIHPGCAWSGVYYVQAPENSGKIEFIDPRTQNTMSPPRYLPNTKRKKSCWSTVNYSPKEGKILFFPSWLYHAVAPNLSTSRNHSNERVIVSFNLTHSKKES